MKFEIAKPTFETIAKKYATKPVAMLFPENVNKIANGCCVGCEKTVKSFKTLISMKEYGISGLCEECQEGVFKK